MTGREPEQRMEDTKPLQKQRQQAPLPSRAERRRMAKRAGVFKQPGAWQQVNRHSIVSGHREPKVNLDK